MAKLSAVDAGPGKPLSVDSMWSILQRGHDINPNQTALMAPTQPVHHLQGLVGTVRSSPSDYPAGSWDLLLRRTIARLTCFLSGMLLPSPSPTDGLSWSFAQLRRATVRLASTLDAKHVPPGATVLLALSSCAEWALMLWVCAFKCYTVVTLDPSILEPGHEQELQDYIEKLSPSVVVVQSQANAIAVDSARGQHNEKSPAVGIILGQLERPQQGWTSMPDISAGGFPDNIHAEPTTVDDPERIAMIVFTSGSSGNPKGTLRTVRDLMRPLTGVKGPPPLRPPTVLINTKTAQSLAPCLIHSTWYSGNAAVLAGGQFDAATTISTIGSCRPVAMALYPPLMDLMQHADFMPEKLKSVKFIFVIGAVTTVSVMRKAQETFQQAKIFASYGMGEAAGILGWPKGPPVATALPVYKGIVSCGMPLPGVKVKVVDKKGEVVERGELGILHLCGDMVASGYHGGEGQKSFYEEGGNSWFITGDCAIIDDQERVFILGRYDDMITRDDTMIAPAAIENVIMKQDPETSVVVMGTSTPGHETRVYAICQNTVQNIHEVKDLVVKELGSSYRVDGIVDLLQLGLTSWPLTPVNKLHLVGLRQRLVDFIA